MHSVNNNASTAELSRCRRADHQPLKQIEADFARLPRGNALGWELADVKEVRVQRIELDRLLHTCPCRNKPRRVYENSTVSLPRKCVFRRFLFMANLDSLEGIIGDAFETLWSIPTSSLIVILPGIRLFGLLIVFSLGHITGRAQPRDQSYRGALRNCNRMFRVDRTGGRKLRQAARDPYPLHHQKT